MDFKEKYKEILDLAQESKIFYYTGGKGNIPVSIQKKPIEEVALIVTNMQILEKLEEISAKLGKDDKVNFEDFTLDALKRKAEEKDIDIKGLDKKGLIKALNE